MKLSRRCIALAARSPTLQSSLHVDLQTQRKLLGLWFLVANLVALERSS